MKPAPGGGPRGGMLSGGAPAGTPKDGRIHSGGRSPRRSVLTELCGGTVEGLVGGVWGGVEWGASRLPWD